jgi:hypothetical protein
MTQENLPKILIFGLDGVGPNTLFEYLNDFPLYQKLALNGAYGTLDCNTCSPTSWASFYLGVPENIHGLTPANGVGQERTGKPALNLYDRQFGIPIWDHLNQNGIPVGLYKSYYSGPDKNIHGFMLYSTPSFNNYLDGYKNHEDFISLNDIVQDAIRANKRGVPRIPELPNLFEEISNGYGWHEVSDEKRQECIDMYLPDKQYHNLIEYYDWHTPLEIKSIEQLIIKKSVNVLMHYTVMTDYIQHFQFHEPNIYTIRQALQATQKRLERLIELYNPDYVLVLSDHGLGPISNLGFDSYSLSPIDGYILLDGYLHKGSIVSGEHRAEGIYILHGPKVNNSNINGIKNHYFYEIICKLFNIPMPKLYDEYTKTMEYTYNILKE